MNNLSEDDSYSFEDPEIERVYSKEAWMMTFTDLLSLMLVFFILVYSTSKVRETEWDKISQSLTEAFNASKLMKVPEISTKLGIAVDRVNIGADLEYLSAVFENKISQDEFFSDKVYIDLRENELFVSIDSDIIYDNSGSRVSDDASVIMFVISEVIQSIRNKVDVIGYTSQEYSEGEWTEELNKILLIVDELGKYNNTSKINALVMRKEADTEPLEVDEKNTIDIVIRDHTKQF